MRRLLSLALALVMCWSVVYVLVPARDASAVETGNATLTGERYTVDWTIPEIGSGDMTTAGTPSSGGDSIEGLNYEILGYVSPKYPDNRATNDSEDGVGELVDGTKASNHFLNDPWVGLYGNENNAVVIDLGAFYTNISDITISLLSDPELGIFLPSKITVASSADGVTYNEVGVVNTMTGTHSNGTVMDSDYSVPTEYESVLYDATYGSGTLFKGQYLLLVFEHAKGADGFDRYWTFISEIDVKTSGSAVIDDFSDVEPMTLYAKPNGADVYEVNVALNSSYQIIGSTGTGQFADTGRIELTDGDYKVHTDINTSNSFVSIEPTNASLGIQLDLGVLTKNISGIAVSGFGGGSNGYAVPTSIELYASVDRETYYSVGLATISQSVNGTDYTVSYDVTSDKAFTARYLTLIVSASGMVMFDEVMVITTNASEPIKDVALDGQYKYLLKTASTSFNDNVWTGSKGNDGLPTLNTYAKGDLNNGISATGTFLDPAWVGYNYSGAASDYVDIVFDLGEEIEGINNVSFKLLEYTNSSTTTACSVPESFTVFYSNTADSFNSTASVTGTVGDGDYDMLIVNSTENRRQVYYTYVAAPNNVTARYIMVRIPKAKRELHIDEIKISTGNIAPTPEADGEYTPLNYDTISGVWLDIWNIPDLYLLQGTYQADEYTYRDRVSNYLTAMVEGGINTVMIHTRAHGDALYGDYTFDSISPVSKRYTGSVYAVSTYDAFEIFVEEAHKVGISVHAWINPLRLSNSTDLNAYDNKYDIKKFYLGEYNNVKRSDYAGTAGDSTYWLNIGYEVVRQHIVNSALEIVNNYDVDAIIMDDYFYPAGATAAFDEQCYNLYLENTEDNEEMGLGDWRRENTNMLVRALYKYIKQANPNVLFGISPAGNITNYENSYNYATMYADVKKWCEETWSDGSKTYKYMDYISPQLYWPPADMFTADNKPFWLRNVGYAVRIDGYLGDWCSFNYVDGVKLVISLDISSYSDTTGRYYSYYLNDNVVLNQLTIMRNNLLEGKRQYAPVDSNNKGVSSVYGQILFSSHGLYDDFSKNVNEDYTAWTTSAALTLQRSADIRNELKRYWQGTLEKNWDGSGN